MFKVLQHLLPTGRAWLTTIDKMLRRFLEGLSESSNDIKRYFQDRYADKEPQFTQFLSKWEDQFGLPSVGGLTEQQRRDRLDAAWKATGGQSPRYIQDTLQANGFDVYVHEWWEPGTEPPVGVKQCATPRNPLMYLAPEYTDVVLSVDCGEPLAACGEAFAECGNVATPLGYPLVNKVFATVKDTEAQCGEASVACGEVFAECGNFAGFKDERVPYIIPNDPSKWPYFLYIGGENFPDIAAVDANRRDEFEALCLKICPAHVWLGILVTY